MTTRATIWTLFVGLLTLSLVVFFAWRAGVGPLRAASEPDSKVVSTGPTVVDDGSVWTMFGGGQGQLGRASGSLGEALSVLWKFKTGAEVKSSAAIYRGRVFIGSSDANVYALDLRTGREEWSYTTDDAVEATPCVIDGTVFVGSGDGFLYALDVDSGQLKWKYETDGEILGSANWTQAPDGQKVWVLIGSYDNRLHCVDAESGQAVWTYETDNYVNGSPAVDDGLCVFGGCDALIHAISLADGTPVVEVDGGSYIAASAAFVGGRVYVGNYDNAFLCADIKGETIVWQYTESDAPIFSSPAVTDDLVVFGCRDNLIRALRRGDGRHVWTFKTLGEVDSSPAICGDKVVVGSEDGRLYVLGLADGKQRWSYEIGQPILSSPAIAQGTVVVGCDDGYVYAFGSVHSVEDAAK